MPSRAPSSCSDPTAVAHVQTKDQAAPAKAAATIAKAGAPKNTALGAAVAWTANVAGLWQQQQQQQQQQQAAPAAATAAFSTPEAPAARAGVARASAAAALQQVASQQLSAADEHQQAAVGAELGRIAQDMLRAQPLQAACYAGSGATGPRRAVPTQLAERVLRHYAARLGFEVEELRLRRRAPSSRQPHHPRTTSRP